MLQQTVAEAVPQAPRGKPLAALVAPVVGLIAFFGSFASPVGGAFAGVVVVILVATVFAAVYHAEVVAHRVGEPFGTLILALAITVIEVALIVSLMLMGGEDKASLARDTVFAAVMIVCNGIIGVCLAAGAVRHHIQEFELQGARAALAVLAALTVMTLVFPNVTTSTAGPTLSASQLVFAGVMSLVLYGAFVFVQTVRHRDFFLPAKAADADEHAMPPSDRAAWLSFALLIVALVAVVGLAKALSPTLELVVAHYQAPRAVVGVAIAAMVLLPEGVAAYRAARANRLQTSMNLALGSALATIGLTVPAVAAVAILLGEPLTLGLGPKEVVLLALTLLVSALTLGTGRTTVLQGIVHLCIFFAFLFYAVVP